MNVEDPLFQSHQDKKQSSSAATTPSMTMTGRSVAASITSDDASGPKQHYWTMPLYLKISLPLTGGVILLPLLIGPIIRLIVQISVHYQPYWRLVFLVVVPIYLTGIGILPILRWPPDYGYFDWPLGIIKLKVLTVYWSVSYGIIFLITVYLIIVSYQRKQHRLRWTLLLFLIFICLVLDTLLTFAFGFAGPLALIPYFYALVSWLTLTTKGINIGLRFRRMWKRGRRRGGIGYNRVRDERDEQEGFQLGSMNRARV